MLYRSGWPFFLDRRNAALLYEQKRLLARRVLVRCRGKRFNLVRRGYHANISHCPETRRRANGWSRQGRLKAVQTRIFSGERRVALSANRRLDVQIPRLAIWRRRLGRVLALVRRRTVLAARGGDGHGEKKQHRPQPSKPHHAPHCALPVHECIDSNHAITASSEIALKSKRPRERKLHRGDP